jgi:hypothetical protein
MEINMPNTEYVIIVARIGSHKSVRIPDEVNAEMKKTLFNPTSGFFWNQNFLNTRKYFTRLPNLWKHLNGSTKLTTIIKCIPKPPQRFLLALECVGSYAR